MAKVFTFDEVAQHNTRDDCWIVLFDKAYDVTAFKEEHPGGDDLLLNATGRDATPDFKEACHTFNAWSMMEKLYVGEVDKSTIPAVNTTTTTPSLQTLDKKGKDATTTTTPASQLLNTKDNKSNKYLIYLLQFLVPLIIVNVAVAFFSKSSA
ncbi:cytochrome [Sesamum alatum]|uniref:Cytochrome n=1 Tax=Sesamum alatum TaxID=300844 RepID=A0AAE2CZT2_9LAMI|nr:cytochrome [Sesamum alatum]